MRGDANVSRLSANDVNILKEIQKPSKEPLSGSDIAARVNLSPSAVSEKLRRFRNEGIISSWSAQIHAEKVNIDLIFLVGVSIAPHTRENLFIFEENFKNIGHNPEWKRRFPQVLECYLLTGDYDYMLKVAARDKKDYRKFVHEELPSLPNIEKITSMMVLDEIHFSTELPLDHLLCIDKV
jgi:Lrp/AsnC family transcriptional regulator, leucine-responsive regulatory protein